MIFQTKVLVMVTLIILLTAFGNSTNSTKINCDKMVYSDDWDLKYLRKVTAYCSNGG